MSGIPMVRAGAIAWLPDVVDEFGGRLRRVFQRSEVPMTVLGSVENLFPLCDCLALLENAGREVGDPSLALRMGARTQLEDLGAFGRVVACSLTLFDAIDNANCYFRSFAQGSRLWLTEAGDKALWCYQMERTLLFGRAREAELALAALQNILRSAMGAKARVAAAQFEHSKPAHLADLEAIFEAPLYFNQPANALEFDPAWLNVPMAPSQASGGAEFHEAASFLETNAPPDDFADAVRYLVALYLEDGYPDIGRVAKKVGLGPRTFQRRLNDMGTNYSRMVEETRLVRAREFFGDRALTLTEISLRLGYADGPAFSRAYKRWTGRSPGVARQRQSPA